MSKRLMDNIERLNLIVEKAPSNSELLLSDQTRLMDFWGDEGVASLGYGPDFSEHLRAFIDSGNPHRLPDVYPSVLKEQASEIICSRTGMERIFYSNSGTEANEAAIKLARKHWWMVEGANMSPLQARRDMSNAKRQAILTLEGNFHGRTGLSLAASDFRMSPYHRHGFGDVAPGFGVINDGLDEVLAFDGKECSHEPQWDKVAAIIMAPVLGNNVVKTYPEEFWKRLQAVRDRHGVLLIFDDVQAGSGRSGEFATYQGLSGIKKPDIMTLSKGIALGLPMSVTLTSSRIASAFTVGSHFNTFGGTLLCCFMAIRLFKYLDDNLDFVRAKGARIRAKLSAKPWIKHVDGMGMLNGFQPDFRGFSGPEFCDAARDHGLSMITHRPTGMIRFTPPLNVPETVLDDAFEALDKTRAVFGAV